MYFRLFYFKYHMQFICSMVDKSFVELHLVIMYAFNSKDMHCAHKPCKNDLL